MDRLEFVKCDREQIRRPLLSFNDQADSHPERVRKLVRQTTYWVYDTMQGCFGPNKFVAYKNMTFDRYENALQLNFYGDSFNGHDARLAIERILGRYEVDDDLISKFVRWAESLFPVPVLGDISHRKWKFVSLPWRG